MILASASSGKSCNVMPAEGEFFCWVYSSAFLYSALQWSLRRLGADLRTFPELRVLCSSPLVWPCTIPRKFPLLPWGRWGMGCPLDFPKSMQFCANTPQLENRVTFLACNNVVISQIVAALREVPVNVLAR